MKRNVIRPLWGHYTSLARIVAILVVWLFVGIPAGQCVETTYSVNLSFFDIIFGSEQVIGTITTNGNTGLLKATDFIAWDLTATGTSGPVTIQSPASAHLASCHRPTLQCGIHATSTTLSVTNAFAFQNITTTGFFLADYNTSGYLTPASFGLLVDGITGGEMISVTTANPYGLGRGYTFSLYNPTIATAVPVPEAEAYAMMLAGLGMLGFVARRRSIKGGTTNSP